MKAYDPTLAEKYYIGGQKGEAKGISLDQLPLEEYRQISPVFNEDIYEAISMKTCVEKRETIGAPGPSVMEQVIAQNRKYLEN